MDVSPGMLAIRSCGGVVVLMGDRDRPESVSPSPRPPPGATPGQLPPTLIPETKRVMLVGGGGGMRPVRIITAVIFAAAVAITGCTAHSTTSDLSAAPAPQ